MLRVVKVVIKTKKIVSKFAQKAKLKIGLSTYFVKVIGQAIMRKESALLVSLLIFQ
jgi:hypothetical protein